MATCQFAFGAMNADNIPALYVGGATVESETVSASNAATTAAATAVQGICRVATDTACYVSFGTSPDAGTDTVRFLVLANGVEYFRVKTGDKAACIAVS